LMPRRDETDRRASADADSWNREDQPRFAASGDSTADARGGGLRRLHRGRRPPKEPPLRIGMLPVARRDTERLRQILSLQRRLMDLDSSPRAKRVLMRRGPFHEALVWLEIHGNAAEALEHWRGFLEALGALPGTDAEEVAGARERPGRERRRRGRRRRGRRET
jgi:Polymerase A arginine-rich C-terminus